MDVGEGYGLVTKSKVTVDKAALFERLGYQPLPHQQDYHNSKARFRVACAGRRAGKSVMAAMDRIDSLLRPRTLGWIVGPCVDEETEILTHRGWLTHDQLEEGDFVLTLNTKGLAEWQECLKVNRHEGEHRMVRIQQRGHDSLTTGNHRWLVGYTGSISGQTTGRQVLGYRWVTTDTMTKPNEFVLGSSAVMNLPKSPKYLDGLVELVGWYWTEGTDQAQGDGVIITQNAGPNAQRIGAAAYSVFGPPSPSSVMRNRYSGEARWSEWKPISGQPTCGRFGFNTHAGRVLRELAPDKVVSTDFISCLTLSQLELLLDVSIKADGHERIRKNGARERVIVQSRYDRLSAMQMVAQLAGYQSTLNYEAKNDKWRLHIFERNKVWLGQKPAVAKREEVDYLGVIWCPTTPNGTWLARRNGTVYFTGNSYDLAAKEFRVMYNKLIIDMELRKDKRTKYNFNIRQGDMYIELPWGAMVIAKSSAKPELLVGEGLHWVIMSEAAKQDQETWERYIRPALADERGGADHVSTPEGKNWWYKLWQRGLEGGNKQYESWRFPSWVNSEVYPGGEDDEEIVLMRETSLEEWFLQEIAAEFTAVVGKIFSEFDEAIHVKPHVFNPLWPNYIAFDWGFANPLAAVEFQVAPDDTIYVWREHYHRYRTLEWHIETLKQRVNPEGYRLDGCFGDAADPDAVAYVSQHFHHCQADPETKTWVTGIRNMKQFLKVTQQSDTDIDDYGRPIEKPRYYVDPACENHIHELTEYRTKKNVGQNEVTGAQVIQSGIDDHTVDAMRYALMHLFVSGTQHHLDEVYPEWAHSPNDTEWATARTPRDLVVVRTPEPVLTNTMPRGNEDVGTFFTYEGFGSGGRF